MTLPSFDRWPASDALGQASRFRLTREQMEKFMLLREIDRHLLGLFGDASDWLARSNPARPFAGRTPLEHMMRDGRRGITDVLGSLQLQDFKASL